MKGWKKILLLCLSAVLAFSAFGCNKSKGKGSGSESGGDTPVRSPVTEAEGHAVEKGLHVCEKSLTNVKIVANGQTEYSIVYDAGDTSGYAADAASVIRKHFSQSTGAQLPVVTDTFLSAAAHDAAAKRIVIGVDEMFASAGLSMPTEDIGATGCFVATKDNSIYIAAKGVMGLYAGALRLLENVIGFHRYSSDTVVYGVEGDVYLPNLRIVDKPDFTYPEYSGNWYTEGVREMGFIRGSEIMRGGGAASKDDSPWHNSFTYINPSNIGKTMGYRFEQDGEWKSYNVTADMFTEGRAQLCYSGGADGDKFDTMTTIVAQQMYNSLTTKFPHLENYGFTAQDISTWCRCERCQAVYNKYGTGSPTVIWFCNEVARKLNDVYFAADAQKNGAAPRKVTVMFFAYQQVRKPPVKTDANGAVVPYNTETEQCTTASGKTFDCPSVVCRPDTAVVFASTQANYVDSFYDDSNEDAQNYLEGWSKLTKNLFLWLYQTNFSHYLYPFNSWESVIDTYRYCRNYANTWLYNQGQFTQVTPTGFTVFKEYIDSRAMQDVTVNYTELKKRFFDAYFMDASEPMRKFFDELVPHMHKLEQDYPELNGSVYCNIAQQQFWPVGLLQRWEGYIAQAYAAIEKYRDNAELYAKLEKHIKMESMFPRYALIDLHGATFSEQELQARKTSFKRDVRELQVSNINEHNEIDSAIGTW